MNLSSAKAKLGLSATLTAASTNVSGSPTVGTAVRTINFADASVAYCFQALILENATFIWNTASAEPLSDCDSWWGGSHQIETATAVGAITAGGNATVTVTSAGMPGSPKVITVPVETGDPAVLWAEKVRVALAADTAVAARFTVSGSTTSIILTRKPLQSVVVAGTTINIYAATDSTLNIALADSTSSGITEAATSANTATGTATAGNYILDGNGKDFEGADLPYVSKLLGVMITTEAGTIVGELDAGVLGRCYHGSSILLANAAGVNPSGPPIYTLEVIGGACLATITAIGIAD